MKLSWRIELAHWLLITAMFAAAAVLWSSAPDRIPVHWNLAGEADRQGGKLEGLLLLPFVALGLYPLLLLLPRIDPGRASYARFATVYGVMRLLITLILAAVQTAMLLSMRGHPVDLGNWARLLVAGVLLVLGCVMGKLRPNWFVGIRTPWTLSSKTSWIKTHRLGGWLFIVMGLSVGASAAVADEILSSLLLLGVPTAACTWLVTYSYLVWRHDSHRIAPTGTVPDDGPPSVGP